MNALLRLCLRIKRANVALLMVLVSQATIIHSAYAVDIEKRVHTRGPISIALTVGKERVVFFHTNTKFGLTPYLTGKVSINSVGREIYLTALEPFEASRIIMRETDANGVDDGKTYYLDISAYNDGEDRPSIELIAGDALTEIRDKAREGVAPNSVMPIDRIVATTMRCHYGPQRLCDIPSSMEPAPIVPKTMQGLFSGINGSDVIATTLESWRYNGMHITAVKISNQSDYRVVLDPRFVRGRILQAAGLYAVLAPAGQSASSAVWMFVTAEAFDEAVGDLVIMGELKHGQ